MKNAIGTTLRLANPEDGRTLPRRLNFTVDALARLSCPAGKDRQYVYDGKVPTLAYVVSSKGARAFYVVKKISGRTQRIRLGGAGDIGIDQARRLALKVNSTVADGADPLAAKRALKDSETVQQLFDRYYADLSAGGAKPSTLRTHKSRFDTCLDALHGRKVLSIHEADVRQAHVQIGKDHGHVSANRAVQLLRGMFNWARMANPVGKGAVDLYSEHSRERFLNADEMRRLFLALDDENISEPIRQFVRLCLFTGARRSNVAAMHSSEIDLNNRTWCIPGTKSKNREAIRIHLSEPALKIIAPRLKHPSGYIFPGKGKCGHLVEPKRSWDRILKTAGLEDVRLHDLRRSLGSWMAAGGSSLAIVGKALGHRSQDSTKIYARLDLSAVRQGVDAATAAMLTAAENARVA